METASQMLVAKMLPYTDNGKNNVSLANFLKFTTIVNDDMNFANYLDIPIYNCRTFTRLTAEVHSCLNGIKFKTN